MMIMIILMYCWLWHFNFILHLLCHVIFIYFILLFSHFGYYFNKRLLTGQCSQTLYALCVLRTHGLCDAVLQTVFQSVIAAKLLYACMLGADSRRLMNDDRQRVNAFLRRGKRCGFCRQDLPILEELLENRDEQLFNKIMNNTQNVLYTFSSYTTGPKISQNVNYTQRGTMERPKAPSEARRREALECRGSGVWGGAPCISFGDMERVPK